MAIYLNGKKILEDVSNTTLRTDLNEDLTILTSGSGKLTLTSDLEIDINNWINISGGIHQNDIIILNSDHSIRINNSDGSKYFRFLYNANDELEIEWIS